jgi:hypothetical protein
MNNPIAFQFGKPPKGIKRLHEYRKFVVFMATPEQFREKEFGCKDQQGFSRTTNISERQLINWKRMEEFWPEVNRVSGVYLKQYTPAVKGAMLQKILKHGDAAEVKLWHQLVEDWSEKTDTSLSVNRESIKALQDANRAIFEDSKKRDSQKK